jgi:hypothetical protein
MTARHTQRLAPQPQEEACFTVMCDGWLFNFLVRGGFVFLVVADEASGRLLPFYCARRIADAFERGGFAARAYTAKPHGLQRALRCARGRGQGCSVPPRRAHSSALGPAAALCASSAPARRAGRCRALHQKSIAPACLLARAHSHARRTPSPTRQACAAAGGGALPCQPGGGLPQRPGAAKGGRSEGHHDR